MSDETQGGDQPQGNPVDLDALVAKMNENFDKRFQGFQGLLDRRDAEYREMLESLKDSELSPEEQEEARARKLEQERDALKRQIELLSMRKDYPDEVDFMAELMQKSSYQDQLEALRAFRKAQAAANPTGDETSESEAGGEPTPVVGNNPKRNVGPSLDDAAKGMTKELSESILSGTNEKGILSRLRRQG
jgi:hypothetical protein